MHYNFNTSLALGEIHSSWNVYLCLYSLYVPYRQYRASIPVQYGCTSTTIMGVQNYIASMPVQYIYIYIYIYVYIYIYTLYGPYVFYMDLVPVQCS